MKKIERRVDLFLLAGVLLALCGAASGSGVSAIGAGGYHTCALATGGGVECWGYNYSGQIGDGTTTNRSTPVNVVGLGSGVGAIGPGYAHNCALTAGGGVKCWGNNFAGGLGDGTTTDRWTPVDVVGLGSGVSAIGGGVGHTCALTTGGGVKCWGSNYAGQLGDGTTTNRPTPVDVAGLGSGVSAISTGGEYNCALTTGGGVKCWGSNYSGELGDGTTTKRLTPVDVVGLGSGVSAISTGAGHTCALTTGGGVQCWGNNEYGELGDGTTTNRPTPVDVVGLGSGVGAIGGGALHTCALTTGGGVKCWGLSGEGEVGDGTTTDRWTPVDVVGLGSGVSAIGVGGYHNCALTAGGGVKCWGYNQVGQLGDGSTTNRLTPVDVLFPDSNSAYLLGLALSSGTLNPSFGSTTLDYTARVSKTLTLPLTVTPTVWAPGATVKVNNVAVVSGTASGPISIGAGTTTIAVDVTAPDGITNKHYSIAASRSSAALDMDGSGTSDVLWVHSSGTMFEWLMSFGGYVGQGAGMVPPGLAVAGIGDFDGDGRADILWFDAATGAVYVWRMNGATLLGSQLLGMVTPGWTIQGVGDLDGDRIQDVLWRGPGGQVMAWRLAWDGSALSYTLRDLGGIGPGWSVEGLADINGDGIDDIVWIHQASGSVYAWLMTGIGQVGSVVAIGQVTPGWAIEKVADFDGDGKADLFWRGGINNVVWTLDGQTVTGVRFLTAVGTDWNIVAIGDYNDDGINDILWRHGASGSVWRWLLQADGQVSSVTFMSHLDASWTTVGQW